MDELDAKPAQHVRRAEAGDEAESGSGTISVSHHHR